MLREARRRAHWVRAFLMVTAGALVVLLLSGCTPSPTQQAEQLMARYGLHPVGRPVTRSVRLDARTTNYGLFLEASKAIGLDLAEHTGKVEVLVYPLRVPSQEVTANAAFVISGGKVVGAWVHPHEAIPGIVPLKDFAGRP